MRRRLITGTATNFAAKLTSVGTWFVLTPLMLQQLGPGGFALWVLMSTITSYGLLLDFGIGSAVVKYVAEHAARDEHGAAESVIASAAVLYLGLAIAAIGLGVLGAPVLPSLLGVGSDQHATASALVLLTGVHVAAAILFTPSLAVLRGLQRYDLHNGVRIAASLFEAVGVTAVLLTGGGLLGIALVLLSSTASAGISTTLIVRRVAPALRYRWRGANRPTMRRIASLSISLFVIDISGRLQTKSAEFVIASLQTLTAVTPYALARKLGELSEVIATQIVAVVMPLASSLDAVDDSARVRRLYVVASRIMLGITVPITMLFTLLGGTILTLWVGPQYAAHADVLAVLAWASLVATSQSPAVEILLGTGRHRLIAVTALGAGLTSIGLAAALLPFGLVGVAFGILISVAASWLGIVLPFSVRTLGVSWRTVAGEIWAPSLVAGSAAAIVLWLLMGRVARPTVTMTMVVGVVLALTVYVAAYVSAPAARQERRLLADIVAGAKRRAGTGSIAGGIGWQRRL